MNFQSPEVFWDKFLTFVQGVEADSSALMPHAEGVEERRAGTLLALLNIRTSQMVDRWPVRRALEEHRAP